MNNRFWFSFYLFAHLSVNLEIEILFIELNLVIKVPKPINLCNKIKKILIVKYIRIEI